MKKITGLFFVLLLFVSAGSLSAKVTITINAPSGTGTPALDTALNNYEATFITELLATDIATLGAQDKLAKGFGNTVGFSSRAASLDGYQGYDLFAFMAGGSVAVQLPSLSVDAIDQMSDDIEKDKDTDAGAGLGSAFNLGLNLSKLLSLKGNRIYCNVKYFTYSQDVSDYSFEATTFGAGLNYQLVDRGGDRWSLFKWTGLSLGTGFLYNKNKIDMKFKFDEYLSGAIPGYTTYKMGFTPESTFGIDVTSYTIPLDISTSVRLLWALNFTLGAGVDFMFGQSEIISGASTTIKLYNNGTEVSSYTPGTATIDTSTKGNPSLVHARLTGGLGICLGPVPVDVSATWYPIDTAFAVNLSTGVVW